MTSLPAGTRLGPYEIAGLIGAGGMGEVYKATDTRLDRVVAIKLLPKQWDQNVEMRQRFEREAQIIASLKHPNICVLHDIGRQDGHDFLVMEYLEGETLAARLDRGAMAWQEAVQVAMAIADALDKAHRQGVVHRDLKPSNVMIGESGAKLLDFGLAKWQGSEERPAAPSTAASGMATRTDLTTSGSLLGTLQYMAPEQLEAQEADARTDIFAFGAVLYEMLAGRKAFEGKTRVLLMSAIATSEPEPLTTVRPETPSALQRVVKTCLAKDPGDRWQTVRDLLAELEWIADGGAEPGAAGAAERKPGRLSRASLVAAGLLVAALAVPAALYVFGSRQQEEARIALPVSTTAQPAAFNGVIFSRAGTDFSVSPDGRTLAFVARTNAQDPWSLFVRPIGSVTPQRLAGTTDATLPFWSGDSRSVGFVVAGKLKRVEASGGPPQEICDVSGFTGGTWNRAGAILFGSPSGLFRVSAEGGKPEAITKLEAAETGHFWPQFLPDGRHYLYTAWSGDSGKRAIFAGSLGSKDKTRVAAAESNAGYAAPGYLLFLREHAVYAQPFHANRLAVSGEPVRVADEVAFGSRTGRGHFSVSESGTLVYYYDTLTTGTRSVSEPEWQLTWIDGTAKVLETPGPPGAYRGIEASPDGTRIAVHRHDATGGDIFVIEPRGSVTRLTYDPSHHNSSPVWSHDGTRILYSALENGKWGLYQTLSSGAGTEQLLWESEAPKAPMSWSADGKRIVFWVRDAQTRSDLWVLTLEDGGQAKAEPLIATPANETHGQVSPDGKWIAYTSDETGRNEVWVQPFPSGSGRYQISFHGGDWPRWRGDSKELFFHAINSTLDTPAFIGDFPSGPLFSAAIAAGGSALLPGPAKQIMGMVALNSPHTGGDYQTYSVSADGKRFLMVRFAGQVPTPAATGAGAYGPEPNYGLTAAIDWTAGLKK
jgi:eukaryotic-like serine/threonine-protein kinase